MYARNVYIVNVSYAETCLMTKQREIFTDKCKHTQGVQKRIKLKFLQNTFFMCGKHQLSQNNVPRCTGMHRAMG